MQPLLVREVLLSDVTVETLCEEIVALLTDPARRERLARGFAGLRERI